MTNTNPSNDPRPDAAPSFWSSDAAQQCFKLLEALVLDTGERWGDGGLQQWQRDAFAATLGLPGAPDQSQNWIEGPTGCGKDQIIAAACLAALRFAPDGYEIINYSADFDRCGDVKKTVRGFIARTDARAEELGIGRWLGQGIEILRDEIRHEVVLPDGKRVARVTVRVESLDGYSASGARADLFLLNEVQSWPDPHGVRVWEESLARYDKLDHGRFVVFSNAPFSPPGDFRRDQRENAAAAEPGSPWWFLGVRLADCPWLTEEKLEKKRRSLPPHVYRRLYLCVPTDGRGELILPDVYDAAVDEKLLPADQPAPGVRYVHGLDIGVTRDHAVHLVLHREKDGRILLDKIRVWVPTGGKQIDLDRIEQAIERDARLFRGSLFADPYQAVQMCQRLERKGIRVTQVPFTATSLTKMCEAVRAAFNDRRMVVFPNAGHVRIGNHAQTSLRRQILEAEVVENERGTRIKSKRGKTGHGDELSALALALYGVTELGITGTPRVNGPVPAPPFTVPARPGRVRGPRNPFRHRDGGRSAFYAAKAARMRASRSRR
jgi:hypothetical protein